MTRASRYLKTEEHTGQGGMEQSSKLPTLGAPPAPVLVSTPPSRLTAVAEAAAAPLTRPNGTQEVGDDGQRADAHAAKRGSGGDVAVELLLQAAHSVAVALHATHTFSDGKGITAAATCRERGSGGAVEAARQQAGAASVQSVPAAPAQRTARKYCWSRSCLATSLADCPLTSIQVMEKRAQTAGSQSVSCQSASQWWRRRAGGSQAAAFSAASKQLGDSMDGSPSCLVRSQRAKQLTPEHEDDVEERVHGVGRGGGQGLGGRDVVDQATHRAHLARELVRLRAQQRSRRRRARQRIDRCSSTLHAGELHAPRSTPPRRRTCQRPSSCTRMLPP